MAGGARRDLFCVDDAADQVHETLGKDTDTAVTGVSDALGVDQEIQVLQSNSKAGVNLVITISATP